MQWLKNVTIDVLVTVLIAVYVVTDVTWAKWIIMIYTPFMLLLKIVVLGAGSLVQLPKGNTVEAPSWFFHLLYGLNVVLLLFDRWWWMAGLWAAIWILSFIAERRKMTPMKAK